MGFRLQHKSMTLNDLERQFTALLVSFMRVATFAYRHLLLVPVI